jgi:hypothetical protein
MLRKTVIALLAVASVSLVSPTMALARSGGGDGFRGNHFSGGFGGTSGDGYGGYGNRSSGLRGGFRGYEDRDVWGHWGAYYGPMI